MKLIDYIKSLNDNDNRFIPTLQRFITHEYIKDYSDNVDDWALDLDILFSNKYASLVLVTENLDDISHIKNGAMTSNFYKWDKLYDTLNLEYNPIWNVDGEELTTVEYGEHTTNNTIGKRNANTIEQGYTFPYDENSKTQTAENNISVSSDAVNDSSVSNQHTDTTTLSRKGNIGVTSTQHLINEERQVAMFSFWEVVYKDIIEAITIPYYEED